MHAIDEQLAERRQDTGDTCVLCLTSAGGQAGSLAPATGVACTARVNKYAAAAPHLNPAPAKQMVKYITSKGKNAKHIV